MPGILAAWLTMMAVGGALALAASGRPRPRWRWASTFLVKWSLADLLIWLVTAVFWSIRELMAWNKIAYIWPLEGMVENATLWGILMTGISALGFLGVSLLVSAIFEEAPELPQGIYIRREVIIATGEAVKGRVDVLVAEKEEGQKQKQEEEQKVEEGVVKKIEVV